MTADVAAPTPRYDVIEKVLEQITEHPETHNQRDWVIDHAATRIVDGQAPDLCGTTMCIAGWAVHFDVGIRWREMSFEWAPGQAITATNDDWTRAGAAALGLDYETAATLFMTYNDAEAIAKLRAILATRDAA